ncbi:hypothetical protein [Botrimarina mediterranea]|uniref:hypothetical protein n=1 Tax=Botrimarina mediterranea TaxID=2528022 RepID=UPI0011891298|nr:hypothetical protein K2D_12900 [Planctomycetes bacterium K2D]
MIKKFRSVARKCVLGLLAVVAVSCGAINAQAQAWEAPAGVTTAITAATAEVEGVAGLAATTSASMLTTVAAFGVVLLIVGAAIAFVWKFFTAGRARC